MTSRENVGEALARLAAARSEVQWRHDVQNGICGPAMVFGAELSETMVQFCCWGRDYAGLPHDLAVALAKWLLERLDPEALAK